MDVSAQERRQAFSYWLRTGRLPIARAPDGVELKFNPYHDPRNGQFTFAPGGARSEGDAGVSTRRAASSVALAAMKQPALVGRDPADGGTAPDKTPPTKSDAVYRPDDYGGRFQTVSLPRNPRGLRGGNSRAFQDPLTLAQTFPGLQDHPAGAIIALADDIFDFGGPARELTSDLTRTWSGTIIDQIKAVDANYRFDSLGFPETLQGQINQLNNLRFQRAATFLRVKGELRPMQVETLRAIQELADQAYDRGMRMLKAGKMQIRLNEQEALGNYIDRAVRTKLRELYQQFGIDSAGNGPVRVNRRENNFSGSDLTFRRPDARVGNVALDVTLTQKTLKTQQIRGFFNTNFKTAYVIIIRPRQLGEGSSYIITRPENK